MKAAGAIVVDADIVTAGQWDDAELQVLLYEFKHDLQAYFAAANAPVKSLADVIEFNNTNAAKELPYFGQELFEQAQAKG